MAAPIRPDSAKLYTREKWVFVPTIAVTSSPAAATEVNAATSLDVSKMFFASSARPSASTNLVSQNRRIGDASLAQFVGETQWTLGEIRYSFSPQAAALSDGKKAFEKFPAGTTGYLVHAQDIPVDDDLAAGDFVNVYQVEFGVQVPVPEGDAEGSEAAIVQTVAITDPNPDINVALAT